MFKRFLLILLIPLISAMAGLLLGDYLYMNQHFPDNAFIERIPVSNLTVLEVIRKLEAADVDADSINFITLYTSSESYEYAPSEIGAYIKPRATAYKAFKLAYEESYIKGLLKRAVNLHSPPALPFQLGLDEERMAGVVGEIAAKKDIPAVEARCVLQDDGKYSLTKEKIGVGVGMSETTSLLKESFEKAKRHSPLIIKILVPRVLKKDLIAHPPVNFIARYKTSYGSHDSPNRIHNIKLLASELNNYIVLSGETFSLLSAMGEVSKEKGFKEAYVIINGELIPQYGGGACQIATTLYNAAMLADLEITSRRNHAIYFYIYPLGRDAAIYNGELDFQFVNNTGNPIMLKSYASDDSLTFRVFGTHPGKVVSISSPRIYTETDGRFINETSREGFAFNVPFVTIVERTVSFEGKTVKREKIRSFYRYAGESDNLKIVRPEPE